MSQEIETEGKDEMSAIDPKQNAQYFDGEPMTWEEAREWGYTGDADATPQEVAEAEEGVDEYGNAR
ncbi:hypothetical protein [Arcanobacterium haemolyticum]